MKKLYILVLAFALTLGFLGNGSTELNAASYPGGKNYLSIDMFDKYESHVTSGGIDLKPSTTYTLSINASHSYDGVDITIYGDDSDYADWDSMSLVSGYNVYTFTTTAGEASVTISMFAELIAFAYEDGEWELAEIQLEEGISRTAYESYSMVISDSTPPLIIGATGLLLINVDSPELVSVLFNSLTATDETDGDVTASIVISSDLYTANNDTLGDYVVQFTANDSAGNYSTISVTYRVIDVIDPIISLNGGTVTVEFGNTYPEPGYSALDNYDGSTSVVVTGTVNNSALGTYTLHYNATDVSGNVAAEKTRAVHVVDTTAPVQTLSGASTIYVEFGQNYTELGATYSDTYDGSGSSVVTGSVNVGILGSYTINYNITDTNGNISIQISRTVIVRDTLEPTFSGETTYDFNSGNPFSLGKILENISASDIYDGDLTSSITITSDNYSGHEQEEGTYTVILSVDDSLDNSASYTLTITIVDNQAPIFSTSERIFTHEYADTLTQQDLKDYFGV